MRQIHVDIDREGRVKMDAIGFVGGACTEKLDALTRALGVEPTNVSRASKPEMFEQEAQTDQMA